LKLRRDLKVSLCVQISALVSLNMATSGEVRRTLLRMREPAFSDLGGSKMETLLIVLLVVFLLGGGWGYSRWRRN
jgi:hypothetical protein